MPCAAPEVVTGTGLQVLSPPEGVVGDGADGIIDRILVMQTGIILDRSLGDYFLSHLK